LVNFGNNGLITLVWFSVLGLCMWVFMQNYEVLCSVMKKEMTNYEVRRLEAWYLLFVWREGEEESVWEWFLILLKWGNEMNHKLMVILHVVRWSILKREWVRCWSCVRMRHTREREKDLRGNNCSYVLIKSQEKLIILVCTLISIKVPTFTHNILNSQDLIYLFTSN
jgi:hypothetical protein